MLIEDPGLQVLAVHSPHPKPLLLDALLENPTEQAMHHTHSAQTDHQAEGAGAAVIISNVHGGAEFVEFETVKDYKFATF